VSEIKEESASKKIEKIEKEKKGCFVNEITKTV
jgi:hypothetical protein